MTVTKASSTSVRSDSPCSNWRTPLTIHSSYLSFWLENTKKKPDINSKTTKYPANEPVNCNVNPLNGPFAIVFSGGSHLYSIHAGMRGKITITTRTKIFSESPIVRSPQNQIFNIFFFQNEVTP